MYYEINVSKDNQHLFATAKRSIGDRMTLLRVFAILDKKFPAKEGYDLMVSHNFETGKYMSVRTIRTQSRKYFPEKNNG